MTTIASAGRGRFNPAQGGARGMKLVAGGLLVAMAALFAASRMLEPRQPAWGYVRAFAEAAMVGGLADWFAVTALFRHPLGLPIPHTAIIPRNKDRIGDTLAAFLKGNFLTPGVVARRMKRVDIAAAAGRFLAEPPGGKTSRLRQGAGQLVATMLEAFDPERLGGMAKGAATARLREMRVAPIIGQVLQAMIEDQRHLPLVDALIQWTGRVLLRNEQIVRDLVSRRAGSLLRWTGLDAKLANAVVDGLYKMIEEVAADPAHPLRERAEEMLAGLAIDLQHDPEKQARIEAIKADLIDNPAFRRWIDGLWEQARAGLIRVARDPERALGGKLGEAIRQLGETLQADAALRRTINFYVRRAVVGGVASYGDAIVTLVSGTIRGWDARTITGRLESAVGRDLQYIRINGTLVGGLVGVVIHVVDRFA